MQSAAKHLACVSNPVDTTVSITTPREMLRCALHDRHLSLFRNKPNKYSASTTYYYDWNISKRNGSTGATTTYSDSGSTVYLTTLGVGDWLDVLLRVSLSCGNFLPASSSWQSLYRFQNGEYCLQSRALPGKATPALAAYPNPADERLLLPTVAGTYTRYNSHGKAVRQPTPPPAAAGEYDTRNLPAGRYYLIHREANGRAVRQAIQVRH